MIVVAVLSQTLRQVEAGQYLSDRRREVTSVITRHAEALEPFVFPPDTRILSWSSEPKPPPSARTAGFVGRLKSWVRGGSSAGMRIDRWLRSAEWRLRYLDRVLALVESRRAEEWDVDNAELIEALESALPEEREAEIVVFDLFDLPTVLSFARPRAIRVIVR